MKLAAPWQLYASIGAFSRLNTTWNSGLVAEVTPGCSSSTSFSKGKSGGHRLKVPRTLPSSSQNVGEVGVHQAVGIKKTNLSISHSWLRLAIGEPKRGCQRLTCFLQEFRNWNGSLRPPV